MYQALEHYSRTTDLEATPIDQSSTFYCEGLSVGATKDEVFNVFTKFGELEFVCVRAEQGKAVVSFRDMESAQKCIANAEYIADSDTYKLKVGGIGQRIDDRVALLKFEPQNLYDMGMIRVGMQREHLSVRASKNRVSWNDYRPPAGTRDLPAPEGPQHPTFIHGDSQGTLLRKLFVHPGAEGRGISKEVLYQQRQLLLQHLNDACQQHESIQFSVYSWYGLSALLEVQW